MVPDIFYEAVEASGILLDPVDDDYYYLDEGGNFQYDMNKVTTDHSYDSLL